MRRHVVDGAATEEDFTGRRGLETGQHHQAGGLAGAGRTEQGQELALANVQVEVFDDQCFAVVALLHTTKADQNIICSSACIDVAHYPHPCFVCVGSSLEQPEAPANRGPGENRLGRLEGQG